jgi:hypothetical protein
MSDELTDKPFKDAAQRAIDEHKQASDELKSRVDAAKAEAMKKIKL